MITIVIAYFERQKLLDVTLQSLLQYDPRDFNVVIVDNGSRDDIVLSDLPYKVEKIKLTGVPGHCGFTYNAGFLKALEKKTDIIIMQGAECSHKGDILSYASKITDDKYISFGCYSLGRGETPDNVVMNNRIVQFDGDSGWYNHPQYRAVGYNFCSAITVKNLIALNGFDERFGYGCGYEDNYFLHQIAMLGLSVEITAYPFVFHQFHNEAGGSRPDNVWTKNRELFTELSKGNTYKAQHTLIPDL